MSATAIPMLPEAAARLERAEFSIEGDPEYDRFWGFHHDSNRWNGWAQPLFTRKTVEALMESPLLADPLVTLAFDGDVLVMTDRHWGEGDECVSRMVPYVVDGVLLYDCGFGWVWDTVYES